MELWCSFSQLSQKLLQNTVNWPRSEPITELAVYNTLKTSTNHKRTHGCFLITWIFNIICACFPAEIYISCRNKSSEVTFPSIIKWNRTEPNKKPHTAHGHGKAMFFFFFFFLLYTIKRSLMVVNAQSWMRHNTLWLPSTSNNQRTDIQHLNRHNFILCRLIQEGVRRHTDSALGVIFTQLYHWLDEWMV